ncbi:MAG: DEAD/DEAH box helicase [Bacteroidetes bacterium]|nr:DEAD/DEAH box helicase [Bacteroidota bacterium]MBL6944076.1 DEAD/DEAH box helicase [Bacteroidales bacterium]
MNNFEELNLNAELISAITELGFVKPTPIQELVIPVLLDSNRDLVGLAQTGTGKTAAFGLPMIQKTDTSIKQTQGIILSPTRELCIQITKDLKSYSKNYKNLRVTAVYGGSSIETQISELQKGTHIVVGTPGRTLDLIKRKKLNISKINTVVLDEADEMLSMGFKEDLNSILETTPESKQTLLFSATMPAEISRISAKFMKNPLEISAGDKNVTAVNVKHIYYEVQARDRYEALKRIADVNPKIYGIIFCRTRRETKEIADKLIQDGYNADALHGDLSQAQRDSVMGKFRSKHLQLLVATDVAARGLDVDDLTHIINYNLPDENDVYIHRSGRTGRAGKSGISLSILHMREKHKLRAVEKMIGRKFDKLLVPSGKEICEKQLFKLVENVEKVEIDESQIAPFLDVIYKKLEWLNREDLIKKFVSVEFNRFLSYYKGAKDLNQVCDPREERKPRQPKERRDRSERQTEFGFSRLFINLGSSTNLNPSSLIGLINQYTRERNIDIGRIEIMKNFSFFEVDSSFEKIILKAFKDASFNDIPIVAELANPKQSIQNTKTPSNFTRKENFKRKENFSKRKKIGKKRRD